MRTITRDITLPIDGNPTGFRLSKLDAFSGAVLLRLMLRLQEKRPDFTIPGLISSRSEERRRWSLPRC